MIFGRWIHDYDLPRICLCEASVELQTRLKLPLFRILRLWVVFQIYLIYLQMINFSANYRKYFIDEWTSIFAITLFLPRQSVYWSL